MLEVKRHKVTENLRDPQAKPLEGFFSLPHLSYVPRTVYVYSPLQEDTWPFSDRNTTTRTGR